MSGCQELFFFSVNENKCTILCPLKFCFVPAVIFFQYDTT